MVLHFVYVTALAAPPQSTADVDLKKLQAKFPVLKIALSPSVIECREQLLSAPDERTDETWRYTRTSASSSAKKFHYEDVGTFGKQRMHSKYEVDAEGMFRTATDGAQSVPRALEFPADTRVGHTWGTNFTAPEVEFRACGVETTQRCSDGRAVYCLAFFPDGAVWVAMRNHYCPGRGLVGQQARVTVKEPGPSGAFVRAMSSTCGPIGGKLKPPAPNQHTAADLPAAVLERMASMLQKARASGGQ